MAKAKTRKIAVKRFKVTGTGKLVHRAQGRRHLRSAKNKSQQRRQDIDKVITNRKYEVTIGRLLSA